MGYDIRRRNFQPNRYEQYFLADSSYKRGDIDGKFARYHELLESFYGNKDVLGIECGDDGAD